MIKFETLRGIAVSFFIISIGDYLRFPFFSLFFYSMPTSPFKTKTFHLTALDREMLDPEHGGLNDISWWYRGYFDGDLYPS